MYTQEKPPPKTLARQPHHHSSPTSGMRQWKIPGVQHSTKMAESRGGVTMTTHMVGKSALRVSVTSAILYFLLSSYKNITDESVSQLKLEFKGHLTF